MIPSVRIPRLRSVAAVPLWIPLLLVGVLSGRSVDAAFAQQPVRFAPTFYERGNYLSTDSRNAVSLRPQGTMQNSPYAEWHMIRASTPGASNVFHLRNRATGGYLAAVSGSRLGTHGQTGSRAALWEFQPNLYGSSLGTRRATYYALRNVETGGFLRSDAPMGVYPRASIENWGMVLWSVQSMDGELLPEGALDEPDDRREAERRRLEEERAQEQQRLAEERRIENERRRLADERARERRRLADEQARERQRQEQERQRLLQAYQTIIRSTEGCYLATESPGRDEAWYVLTPTAAGFRMQPASFDRGDQRHPGQGWTVSRYGGTTYTFDGSSRYVGGNGATMDPHWKLDGSSQTVRAVTNMVQAHYTETRNGRRIGYHRVPLPENFPRARQTRWVSCGPGCESPVNITPTLDVRDCQRLMQAARTR